MLGVLLTGPSGGPDFWHVLRGGRVLECWESFTEKGAPEGGAECSTSVAWKELSNPRRKSGEKYGQ